MRGFDTLWLSLTSEIVVTTSTFLLMVVFLVAGVMKIRHPQVGAGVLVKFHVVRRTDKRLGRALGLSELFIGLGISGLLGRSVAITASFGAIVATTSYVIVVAHAVRKGDVDDCHCFSARGAPLDGWTLTRNIGLFLAALSAGGGVLSSDITATETQLQGILLATVVAGTAVSLRVAHSSLDAWKSIRERLDWDRVETARMVRQ